MPKRPKITSYRVIPPRIRIIYSESDRPMTPERYLSRLDQPSAPPADEPSSESNSEHQYRYGYQAPGADFASSVMGHRLREQRAELLQTAGILLERQAMSARHLRDIRHERYRLMERKPLRRRGIGFYDDHKLTEIEKIILDLQRQERAVEAKLWSDALELRQTLVGGRREYRSLRDRLGYLDTGWGYSPSPNYGTDPAEDSKGVAGYGRGGWDASS